MDDDFTKVANETKDKLLPKKDLDRLEMSGEEKPHPHGSIRDSKDEIALDQSMLPDQEVGKNGELDVSISKADFKS
jgi:hypothetical protein